MDAIAKDDSKNYIFHIELMILFALFIYLFIYLNQTRSSNNCYYNFV
jgi:hypothetical protein